MDSPKTVSLRAGSGPTGPTDHRRDLVLLFGALTAFSLSLSMLLPTLPIYLRDLGSGPIEVGLVIGVFSLGVLVVRPIVGRAVDQRGRRPVLLLGSLVAAAVAPLYLWTAIVALVAVRIVHGAGLSAFTSASTTLVTDLSPPERRTEYLGYLSTSSILAFAFGPVVGVEVAERFGYAALFVAIGATALVSAGCAAALRGPPPEPVSGPPPDYRAAIFRRAVLVPTATLLLVTLAHGGAFAFLPIHLERRLTFNLGVFFLVYSGASLLVRLAAGRISRRWGDGPMIWGGLALYASGLLTLPFVHGWGTMSLAAILFGVGFGTYQPAVYGIVANAAADETRGMVFSVFLGAFDLGMSLGGLVSGPIVAWIGIPALLGVLGIAPIAAAAVFVAWLGWHPSIGSRAVPCEASLPS